ncbi:HAD-IB family hydrolase [Halomonas urmiana]|uniref:HAD-IB family hydrolase n=1 Tax=Halomonas urmiana TaxID=490901 RepID=A0A5R8M8Q8_9GAMM|nr:HAD-IB family hydrolase [Halomonas urmiana]TLF45963.1 HAD-IB family hydrolase [Halomonas urmiana]
MNLALFDLDDTLLDGDITGLWNDWLIDRGWIDDAATHRATFGAHMRAYGAGELDMEAHLRLLLAPLAGRAVTEVADEVEACLDAVVMPRLFPAGRERLAWHSRQGHRTLIISASTAQLVAPLARRLGVDGALATALEVDHGGDTPRYTGRATGTRTFREGKLAALDAWLAGRAVRRSWGYSDSRNDLALLEAVDHAHAIHPDPALAGIARARGWAMPDWRR